MHLIPFVQYRSLWIFSHASRSHLVDSKPDVILVVIHLHIFETRCLQHLRGTFFDVLTHYFFILFPLSINVKGRQSEDVFLLLVESHSIIGVGKTFAKPRNAYLPGTWRGQRIFEIRTKHHFLYATHPTFAARAALVAETS